MGFLRYFRLALPCLHISVFLDNPGRLSILFFEEKCLIATLLNLLLCLDEDMHCEWRSLRHLSLTAQHNWFRERWRKKGITPRPHTLIHRDTHTNREKSNLFCWYFINILENERWSWPRRYLNIAQMVNWNAVRHSIRFCNNSTNF